MTGNPFLLGNMDFLKQLQNFWTQNSNCALYKLFSLSASFAQQAFPQALQHSLCGPEQALLPYKKNIQL